MRALGRGRPGVRRQVRCGERDAHARVGLRIGLAGLPAGGLDRVARGLLVRGRDDDHRRRVARDRVAARAAVERGDPDLGRHAERSREDLDRVRAAGRDVAAGVPAAAAAHRDAERDVAGPGRLARPVQAQDRVDAARAADRERRVLLAVEVEQHAAADQLRFELGGAGHADLLRDGHQQLERPVRSALVLGEREHRRDRDAVVGAERRALGAQPVTVADDVDPPRARVVRAVRIALADDVEVALEGHGRRGLAARRGGHVDDEVAGAVAPGLEPALLGPRDHVRDGPLLLVRRRAGSRSAPRGGARTRRARGRRRELFAHAHHMGAQVQTRSARRARGRPPRRPRAVAGAPRRGGRR